MEEKQIEPHVPVWEKSDNRQGIFNRDDFTWNAEADNYTCSAGKELRNRWRNFVKPRSVITKADTIIYRARKTDCDNCTLKYQCCPSVDFRKIVRSIHESSREVAREIGKTPEYLQSRKDRKKVEVLFAHLKRIMKLERLRLRGLSGANDEFLLAASVQNLKKLAKLRYKPPDIGIVAPV